jgi:hypothetical protein
MHVDSAAEYWHRSASLVHTDPLGQRDAEIPPEVRIYAIGGTQHSTGNGVPQEATPGQLPLNPTDYRPIMRALLVALEAWVRDDTPPPPSVYPRISDGTLVGWNESESGWQALPGVRYPEVIQRPPLADYGPKFLTKRRIAHNPPLVSTRTPGYTVRVPQYGPDNNERGMLLLPFISVPVATYTGWNTRARETGAESELLGLAGGYIPFARTEESRLSSGDPRPALLERYRGFDDYLQQYRAAAQELIRQRYLLREDLELLLGQARKHRALFGS